MNRRITLCTLGAALCAATIAAATVVPQALAAGPAPAGRGAEKAPTQALYLVGGAAESINPTKATLAKKDFYLGGYGFGDMVVGGEVQAPGTHGRYATGILGDGVHSRALMVSDRRHTIALAQIETQGYFASYKQGPFGIEEIRHDAAAQIASIAKRENDPAPVPTAAQILVDSDHTHGGPDTVGVWGGVPTSYLREVHNRTVTALVHAWKKLTPATLTYGVAHAGVEGETKQYPPSVDDDPLLTNQFSSDPHNQAMDDQIRVLQAHDPSTGKVLDTYVNYSSHPTVLGSDNTLATGDYVGRLNDRIARHFGGFGMDQVGTLGRTQPARASCTNPKTKGAAASLCALDQYAARVMVKVKYAVQHAQPLRGPATVGLSSYLVQDLSTSPVLVSVDDAGTLFGAPAGRTNSAPWFTGTVIGTTTFSGHIGTVMISGGPGEMYPQIPLEVRKLVKGEQGYLSIGTAGDFLGYLIAPFGAYPEPIRRSILSGDPPPKGDQACALGPISAGCPDPVGNDNFFFNVSVTMGTRLTCMLLRGSAITLGKPQATYLNQDKDCAPLFSSVTRYRPGKDTTYPEQPNRIKQDPHM